MCAMPFTKYRPYKSIELMNRQWPSKAIARAPLWCSVDLRDGNQALPVPIGINEKLELFHLLTDLGFKEIEAGFPSASQTDFDFIRTLIDTDVIPEDTTIQILTQARDHLIKRSFDALKGIKRVIVHLYNSTSTLQRRVVFKMTRKEIINLAVSGAEAILEASGSLKGSEVLFQYSPESFTGTEPDFALDICEAVLEVWKPDVKRKVLINLPATVEMSTPNVYADRIEWFCNHISNRDSIIISIHAHNDRGCAVAATELALMAGGDRVEGTLFGNGERTGNVDIVTVAMNMFSQGVDPKLDFGNIDRVKDVYERCTGMSVHPRHPYAGELVYTAFSGSHQDAISKGVKAYDEDDLHYWDVPYLPIDPSDVGRKYESLIRINSQSGKGGIAYIMENFFGYRIPKEMQPELADIVQAISEKRGNELSPDTIYNIFVREYLENEHPYEFISCDSKVVSLNDGKYTEVDVLIGSNGSEERISGYGNGPIDAFCKGFNELDEEKYEIVFYSENSLESGSDAKAIAYIGVEVNKCKRLFGAGANTDIMAASIKAFLSAVNRHKTIHLKGSRQI